MKNLKTKILAFGLLALTFGFFGTTHVFAKEKPFYTNMNGVKLTETQYNNLAKAFSNDTIATLTQNMANIFKDDETLASRGYSKYVRVDTLTDFLGNVISTTETEVTEKEALDYIANQNDLIIPFGYPVHQTAMKRLTINVTTGISYTYKTITLINEWLSMPVTRSNDVIAIRPDVPSFTINIGNISGYLKHNGTIVQSYTGSHSNVRNINNQGVGISMPLPTGGSTMSNGMSLLLISGADPFRAYGSFQHAQSAVTLADSKVYNINSNGLGGVLDFTNSTTRAKYDAMQGVWCEWSLGTLSCN